MPAHLPTIGEAAAAAELLAGEDARREFVAEALTAIAERPPVVIRR